MSLYPLKFKPILKDSIWAGDGLKKMYPKFKRSRKFGESWELSAVDGNVSVVSNGFLKGNDLQELIEVYMDELVGEGIYNRFGINFPLLVKFIHTSAPLSVQVHPDDEKAAPYDSFGKTEMWYVIDSKPGARLISGFSTNVNSRTYLDHLSSRTLPSILNSEETEEGDVFFIPAGRVHALGEGLVIAEIQQTSDITYRIYDWDRVDADGKPRQLHNDKALDCIDFSQIQGSAKTSYSETLNKTSRILSCPYFTTNHLVFDRAVGKDYSDLDSFVILVSIEGEYVIQYEDGMEPVYPGETVLLPASLDKVSLFPKDRAKLLEIYIDSNN